YATEEIMVVLLATSASSRHLILPIAIAIGLLIAIVVASYVQVCKGYPSGGGAYIVAKDNLAIAPALIAAAALLVDYILTVAVSVVAGVVAVVGAAPSLGHYAVELSIGAIVLLTLVNLRGVRETGAIFAFPTYAFIFSVLAMIVVGLVRCAGGCPSAAAQHVKAIHDLARSIAPVGLFVILHGFYAGQIFTALILVLAANTAYQGFPRLLAILAQDRFVARQFRNLGDRLVFSNGVIVLAGLAAILIVVFQANLDKLIQLYVVGV